MVAEKSFCGGELDFMMQTTSSSYGTGAKMITRLTHAVGKRKSSEDSTSRHIRPAHELILIKRDQLRTGVGERVVELFAGLSFISRRSGKEGYE